MNVKKAKTFRPIAVKKGAGLFSRSIPRTALNAAKRYFEQQTQANELLRDKKIHKLEYNELLQCSRIMKQIAEKPPEAVASGVFNYNHQRASFLLVLGAASVRNHAFGLLSPSEIRQVQRLARDKTEHLTGWLLGWTSPAPPKIFRRPNMQKVISFVRKVAKDLGEKDQTKQFGRVYSVVVHFRVNPRGK